MALLAGQVEALAQSKTPPQAEQPKTVGSAPAAPNSDGPTKTLSEEEANTVARTLMLEGIELFRKKDYEGAYHAYSKAWEVKRHFTIAANLIEVSIKLERYEEAAELIKSQIALVTDDKQLLLRQQAECRKHLASLNISATVSGAHVLVDGKEIGTSPLTEEPLASPETPIKVTAELTGYEPATAFVTTGKAGEVTKVVLELKPINARPEPVAVKPVSVETTTETTNSSSMRTRNIVVASEAVLTVAAAVVGGVYLVKRGNSKDDAESLRDELSDGKSNSTCYAGADGTLKVPTLCKSLSNAWERYDRQGNIASGFFIGAGVGAVATIATYFLWPTKQTAERTSSMTTKVVPWTSNESAGIQVFGTF
jgi:tetratricopeptide (TPR) repeat protein